MLLEVWLTTQEQYLKLSYLRPLRSLGSISGGGRYDDLVSRFTGQKVPSTGVSIGIDRLVSFLHERDSDNEKGVVDVLVTVMDKNLMQHYIKIAAELRENGINTDLYVGNPKDFGKQMKYADSRGAAFAIVAGTNEVKEDIVQIKDLKLGSKLQQITFLQMKNGKSNQHNFL